MGQSQHNDEKTEADQLRAKARKKAISMILGVTQPKVVSELVPIYVDVYKNTKWKRHGRGQERGDDTPLTGDESACTTNILNSDAITKRLSRAFADESFPYRKLLFGACIRHRSGTEKAENLFEVFDVDYVRFSDWEEILYALAIDKGYTYERYIALRECAHRKIPDLKDGLIETPERSGKQTTYTRMVEDEFVSYWPKQDDGGEYVISMIRERKDWFHSVSLTRRNILFQDILGNLIIPEDFHDSHGYASAEYSDNNNNVRTKRKLFEEFAMKLAEALGEKCSDIIDSLIEMNDCNERISKRMLIAAMKARNYSKDDIDQKLIEANYPPAGNSIRLDRLAHRSQPTPRDSVALMDRTPLEDKTRLNNRRYIVLLDEEKCFAEGGSALIYKAIDDSEKRHVLIKEVYPRCNFGKGLVRLKDGKLHSDDEAVLERHKMDIRRVLKEKEAINRLADNSSYVAHTISHFGGLDDNGNLDGENNNTLYIVKEFKNNHKTLGEYIDSVKKGGEPIDLETALYAIRRLCLCLIAFHERNWLHLDISPDNIIVTDMEKDSQFPIVQLTDFNNMHETGDDGYLKDVDKATFVIAYKWDYSPIEVYCQDMAKISRRSDTFSVVKVFRWLLFGERRYTAIADATPHYENTGMIVMEKVNQLLRKGLSGTPSERYESAESLLHDIEGALAALKASDDVISERLVNVNTIAVRINDLLERSGYEVSSEIEITGAKIYGWLVKDKYLKAVVVNGRKQMMRTRKGRELGIVLAPGSSPLFDSKAQKYIANYAQEEFLRKLAT